MKSKNTQNQKIDWKNINKDNDSKLKALKKLIKEYDGLINDERWTYFYITAMNIIDNHLIK